MTECKVSRVCLNVHECFEQVLTFAMQNILLNDANTDLLLLC